MYFSRAKQKQIYLNLFIMENVLTQAQLVNLLSNIKGATLANITYFVDESKSRQKQGKKLVQKLVKTNVTINSDYARKVNRILEQKQGVENAEFVPKEMKGKKMINSAILESAKDGKLMMYCTVENHAIRTTRYFVKGIETSFEDVKNADLFAPAFFKPKATAGRGTVEKENDFCPITPKIESIREISIKGEKYKVI
jgi:hypothetical protein